MKFRLLFILPTFLAIFAQAQTTGKLSGWVIDKNTQKPIAGVNVKLINTNFGTVTDSLGKYQFKSIPTGQYQVSFTSLGTLPYSLFNVVITVGNETNNTIELLPADNVLKEVQVSTTRKTVRTATLETPLSVQKLTAEEI